jgi:hypothetical protein
VKFKRRKGTPEDGALKRRNASRDGLEVWLYVIKVLPKGWCVIIIQIQYGTRGWKCKNYWYFVTQHPEYGPFEPKHVGVSVENKSICILLGVSFNNSWKCTVKKYIKLINIESFRARWQTGLHSVSVLRVLQHSPFQHRCIFLKTLFRRSTLCTLAANFTGDLWLYAASPNE